MPDERPTADDLRGMLHDEIVAVVDRMHARLAASEAEIGRLQERLSFATHKRAQCEANLEASEAAREALVAALREIAEVCANPDNPDFVAACTSGEIASRALQPSGGREGE